MKLLAVETSSSACSVALGLDGEVTADHVVEPRAHTRILMPMISRLLDDAQIEVADLDAIVLGNGPGSFIGMRIGASVAQGLAYASGLGIIPVSSLAAVAAEALSHKDAERVVVAQDARMNEVYLGIFARDGSNLPVAETAEKIQPVGALDDRQAPFFAAGGGWERYPALLELNANSVLGRVEIDVPDARYLLELAASGAGQPVPPDKLVPAYLRQKVADRPAGRP